MPDPVNDRLRGVARILARLTLTLLGIIAGCSVLHPATLVDDELEHARAELAAKRFSSAEATLRALMVSNPDNPEPALALADCYLVWGKPEMGLSALEEASRRGAPTDEVAERRLSLLLAAGAWEELQREAEHQLQKTPTSTAALSALVEAALHQGDCASARRVAAQLARVTTADSAKRTLAVLEVDLEQIRRDAPDLLGSTETCEPHCALRVGYRLVEQEAWDLALCVLEEAIRTEPASAEAHAWLGETLERLGHSQEAVAHLQQAIQLAPTSPLGWLLLAKFHMTHGNLAAAEVTLGRSRELAPNNPAVYLATAELRATQGRYAEMSSWARKATSLASDDPYLWQSVARLYLARMLIEDPMAMEAAKRATSLAPDAAESHLLLGWAYLLRNEPQKALPELQEAVNRAPMSGEAHYLLAQALRQLGHTSTARDEEVRAADLGYPVPGSRD